jgi:hypothetical protein
MVIIHHDPQYLLVFRFLAAGQGSSIDVFAKVEDRSGFTDLREFLLKLSPFCFEENILLVPFQDDYLAIAELFDLVVYIASIVMLE